MTGPLAQAATGLGKKTIAAPIDAAGYKQLKTLAADGPKSEDQLPAGNSARSSVVLIARYLETDFAVDTWR